MMKFIIAPIRLLLATTVALAHSGSKIVRWMHKFHKICVVVLVSQHRGIDLPGESVALKEYEGIVSGINEAFTK